MVQRKKATEAAVHHRDLLVPCSSEPVVRRFVEWFVVLFHVFLTDVLTHWRGSDVDVGLDDVSALHAGEGAGVRSRVLLDVWPVQQERPVAQLERFLVQFSLTLPLVEQVSGFAVVPQDDCGIAEWREGPGEGEVLDSVRAGAGDGQCETLLMCDTVWNKSNFFAFIYQSRASYGQMYQDESEAHLVFSMRLSTLVSCRLMWLSRRRCNWRDYPESSACSPHGRDPCGPWFWWLSFLELPGQTEALWPRSPEELGRCCGRSMWPSCQSATCSLIGWELDRENGQHSVGISSHWIADIIASSHPLLLSSEAQCVRYSDI